MVSISEDFVIAFGLGILFTVGCLVVLYVIDMWYRRDPALRETRNEPIEYNEPTLEKGPSRVVHHDPLAL